MTPDGRSLLGMVTLLRNESNVHAEWGDPDIWAEDPVVAYMAGRSIDRPHQFDLKPARVAEVLRVCRDAIRAEEPFDRPE